MGYHDTSLQGHKLDRCVYYYCHWFITFGQFSYCITNKKSRYLLLIPYISSCLILQGPVLLYEVSSWLYLQSVVKKINTVHMYFWLNSQIHVTPSPLARFTDRNVGNLLSDWFLFLNYFSSWFSVGLNPPSLWTLSQNTMIALAFWDAIVKFEMPCLHENNIHAVGIGI